MRLGEIYLTRQLAPLAMSNMRIVATQPAESNIGEEFYRNVLCPAWKRVADAFKALMAEGKLRRADPWLAAMHFKGLVLQDLLERQLLGAAKSTDPKEIEAAAKHAADAFLRIYGTRGAGAEARSAAAVRPRRATACGISRAATALIANGLVPRAAIGSSKSHQDMTVRSGPFLLLTPVQ